MTPDGPEEYPAGMATVPERLASLESKVDTLTLDIGTVKTDVRQLLVRDIERAVVQKYVGRITRAVPWAALVAAGVALLGGK